MNGICEQAREMITRHLDSELSSAEIEELSKHLETCQSCREELEAMQMLRQTWQEPPAIESRLEDRAAILAAAGQVAVQQPGLLERFRQWLVPSDLVTATAMAASVVLLVLLLEGRSSDELPKGWSRSSTVLSMAEYRARIDGTQIEIDENLNLIRVS